jgi:hypothetical protein
MKENGNIQIFFLRNILYWSFFTWGENEKKKRTKDEMIFNI